MGQPHRRAATRAKFPAIAPQPLSPQRRASCRSPFHRHALDVVRQDFAAARVHDDARARLHRKRAVPVERLRDAGFERYLIRYWDEAVKDLDARSAMLPDLRNRDSDPLLLTVDFEVATEAMAAIEARIAEMEGTQQERTGEDSSAYVFLRPDDSTRPDGDGRRPDTDGRQGAPDRDQLAGAGRRAARTDRGALRLSHPTPRASTWIRWLALSKNAG